MTAGALAVMRRRRANVAAQQDAAALSPFDLLPSVLLSWTLRMANLMMRDLAAVRLVCHEWTQTIDAHLRSAARRYCILPKYMVYEMPTYCREELAQFNMFAESGWMVDATTPLNLNTPRFRQLQVFRLCNFPNPSNENWLFSLLSQLATLPVLEDITIGSEETCLTTHLDDLEDETYFTVLRVLLAQLKRVHTFRGNLGLIDDVRIHLVDAVKALPSLRHIDSEAGDEWCADFWIRPDADVAKSISSLSQLQLESVTCIRNDVFFWEHFSAAEQCNMKRLKVRVLAGLDASQTATECARLVDEVRRMPKLEELEVSFGTLDNDDMFCTCGWSKECDRSPENVIFSRALRSQLEQLVHQEMGTAHSLAGDGDTHDEFMERALRLLAPQIRVDSCYGP